MHSLRPTRNRTVLASLLLVAFVFLPMQVIASGTVEHVPGPRVTHDFWLGPLSSQVYSFECLEGSILEGELTVTSDGDHFPGDETKYDLWPGWGDGVDIYVFDNQSYEAWSLGLSSVPQFNEMDITEFSWSVRIPYSGYWYVVYDNDSSVYGKQVEGTITHLYQDSQAIGLLILCGGAIISIVGVLICRKR